MSGTTTLGIGNSLVYDGDLCTVVELSNDAVIVRDSRQRTLRLRLVDVLRPESEGGRVRLPERGPGDVGDTPIGVMWNDASDGARAVARSRADHVREVLTGYRSGTEMVPREGEPQASFLPEVPLLERQRAKAEELGVGMRTIRRWISLYRDLGEPGLLDRRVRAGKLIERLDPIWVATARTVLNEQVPESKVAVQIVINRIEARLRAGDGNQHSVGPSRSTAYKALAELDAGRGTFQGPTKRKRSIGNRPDAPYGRLRASRPGEYVLLDTTPLNVFAVVPVTGEWLPVELTIAIDLYSRCILGLRVTPASTKSIDVAGVLLESFLPFETDPEWGPTARWPYHGIPQSLLVDPERVHPCAAGSRCGARLCRGTSRGKEGPQIQSRA